MKRVKNKVAVVTGAALGIGRATAIRLAEEGARVAITDVLDIPGAAVVAEIKKAGGDAAFWHLDVSKEAEVKRVMSEVAAKWGKIDVLVNNAGISGVNKPTDQLTEQEWDALMAVNVKGVFFCTKHAIPWLRKAGAGSIINLSSIYGIIGAGDVPAYHASKGAVAEMSKNDAITYAKEKIRVNSVPDLSGPRWSRTSPNLPAARTKPAKRSPPFIRSATSANRTTSPGALFILLPTNRNSSPAPSL